MLKYIKFLNITFVKQMPYLRIMNLDEFRDFFSDYLYNISSFFEYWSKNPFSNYCFVIFFRDVFISLISVLALVVLLFKLTIWLFRGVGSPLGQRSSELKIEHDSLKLRKSRLKARNRKLKRCKGPLETRSIGHGLGVKNKKIREENKELEAENRGLLVALESDPDSPLYRLSGKNKKQRRAKKRKNKKRKFW